MSHECGLNNDPHLGLFTGDVTLFGHKDTCFSCDILPRALDIASLPQYYKPYLMEPTQIAMIVALIISVIIHEMAHGYAANWLGDPTARLAGRLSPNPLVHLDPMMSVILPGLLLFQAHPFFSARPNPCRTTHTISQTKDGGKRLWL